MRKTLYLQSYVPACSSPAEQRTRLTQELAMPDSLQRQLSTRNQMQCFITRQEQHS